MPAAVEPAPAPVAGESPPEPAPEPAPAVEAEPERPRFVDGHLVSAAVAAGHEAEPEPAHDTGPAVVDGPLQLTLSTGETVPLDRGVLLGRAPKATAAIGAAGEPHLVRVPSPDNEISRSHVEVYPEGDGVVVRDLGSTNGTTITPPDGQPSRLAPGAPHPFELGSRLLLAGHVEVLLEEA